MPVKVIVKGKQPKEQTPDTFKVPAITPPRSQNTSNNIFIRMIKIMLMDIRIKFNPQLKKEYDDYSNFCNLARGKP